MKTKFFVDFENVGVHGVKREIYESADIIYLFYTENASRISMDALSEITASVRFVPVPSGKQSLDMHLATWLGYEISQGSGEYEYCVVSNDLDYDAIIQFWKAKGIAISRLPIDTSTKAPTRPSAEKTADSGETITSTIQSSTNPETAQSQRASLNERIMKMCSAANVEQKTAGAVASTVLKHYYSPDRKEKIYGSLIKAYGAKAGARYYRIVKQAL